MSSVTWALVFPVRALGDFLFVPDTYIVYRHLQRNGLLNQLALAGPILLLVVATGSAVWSYVDDRKKLPKRDKILRKNRQQKLNVRYGIMMLKLAPFGLLLLPGMRDYTIVTPNMIIRQSWYASEPQIYPLDQLVCIRQSVAGRGIVFQDFQFADGRTFFVSGLDTQAIDLILHGAGLSDPWAVDCERPLNL
ncbi:hypothetical protein JHS3_14250 [Jeongeupia sp. HS-3]|nr:hypothetical protein JHS3_14250 [Jeongeupia sp. HS-3]